MASAAEVRQQLEAALPRAQVAAYRWLGDRDESRDACQEAAARALTALDSFDASQPLYPWFYRILKNHCMDRLKGRGKAARAAGELRHEASAPAGRGGAEHQLVQRERQRAVAEAITRLPEELREVIELRHFQDLSYEEMAGVIGCPTGTVMSRLYRARKVLRQLLLSDDPQSLARTGDNRSEP